MMPSMVVQPARDLEDISPNVAVVVNPPMLRVSTESMPFNPTATPRGIDETANRKV